MGPILQSHTIHLSGLHTLMPDYCIQYDITQWFQQV